MLRRHRLIQMSLRFEESRSVAAIKTILALLEPIRMRLPFGPRVRMIAQELAQFGMVFQVLRIVD